MVKLTPHKANTKVKSIMAPPYVLLEPLAIAKMNKIIDECADEVGWFGVATRPEPGIIHISDIYLPKQVVNGATCEIDPQGLAELATEILALPDGMDVYNNLNMWGHSHVNMGVSPSGQDEKQFMELVSTAAHNDWFVRVIANKKGEMKIDLLDTTSGLLWEDLEWEMHVHVADISALSERIKSHVQKKVYMPPTTAPAVGAGYGLPFPNSSNATRYGAKRGTDTKSKAKKNKEKKYNNKQAEKIANNSHTTSWSSRYGTVIMQTLRAEECPRCGNMSFLFAKCDVCNEIVCLEDYDMDFAMCDKCTEKAVNTLEKEGI